MQPLPLRDEAQPGYEPGAWQPNWRCFCCHDTGIVLERMVKTVMPNYVLGRHKPVECNATGCQVQLGELLYQTNTLDTRFTPQICDRLEEEEREMWRKWSLEQHQKRLARLRTIETDNLTFNLRRRSRTNYEQLEVERRHQDLENEY